MSPTHKHTMVIGGGLSGLAASYDLVRAGQHVAIPEATSDFGGLGTSRATRSSPFTTSSAAPITISSSWSTSSTSLRPTFATPPVARRSSPPYAQAVFTTNFADLMPAHQTPVKELYVTDSTQFYPEDRTIRAAIEQGRKVVAMIVNDSRGT